MQVSKPLPVKVPGWGPIAAAAAGGSAAARSVRAVVIALIGAPPVKDSSLDGETWAGFLPRIDGWRQMMVAKVFTLGTVIEEYRQEGRHRYSVPALTSVDW
ncbi:hypothetical protein ACFFKH_04150 [Micromonospora marina]|uniref:hypothetical protein n=1 Tax=Micromonospora marina TaxID=307120 RepID=UPI001FC90BFF|nr:hypothetical protein [Micromonospora marina]